MVLLCFYKFLFDNFRELWGDQGWGDLLCIQFAILCTWEKDERIDELLNKNESLEIEKMEALKEIECLEAKKRQEEGTIDNMEK